MGEAQFSTEIPKTTDALDEAARRSQETGVAPQSASALGGILKLATARGIAIVVSFATAPVVARLYPPSAYGAMGVFTTLLNVLSAFGSLSFLAALPLAATACERRDLFVLCSILGVLTTGLVTVGAYFGADWLAVTFHEPSLSRYAFFFPLLFLGQAINIGEGMGIRNELTSGLGSARFRAGAE